MRKSSTLWQGTFVLLILGLAIDRYATERRVKELEHEYHVVAAAAAEARADTDALSRARPQPASPDLAAELASPNAAALAARSVALAPSAAPAAEPPPVPEPPPEPRAPPEPRDQVAHIDAVFSTQTSDVAWARVAETKLTSALSHLAEEGARVRDIECRSTLCKATIDHTSENGMRAFVGQAFTQANYWPGAMVSWLDPNSPQGTWSNVMYFSKETAAMPALTD